MPDGTWRIKAASLRDIMKGSEKQINKSQLFCMIIIVGLTSAVLALPQVLAAEAGRDLWVSMLLGFAVCFLPLVLIVQIYKLNPDAGLYEIIKNSLGHIGAKIIYALFFLYFGWKTLMLFGETKSFCLNRLYDTLPWYFYALIFGGFAAFMAARGLKASARLGELSLFFLLAALVICVCTAAGGLDPKRLLPVMENGFASVFKGFYKTAVWFGDFLVLFMMLGKIKPDGKLPRALYAGWGATAFLAVAFAAVYRSLYGGLSEIQGRGAAFASIADFSGGGGRGPVSGLLNQIWLLACFVKLAVLFWAANEALMKICGCQKPLYTALPLAAALYVLSVFAIDKIGGGVYIAVRYGNYLAAAVYTIAPVIILICAVIYKRGRLKA